MKEIKRLTNAEMENIAGGVIGQACAAGVVVCGVSAVGCKVGNLVWRVKANNALKRGDEKTFCKFNGNANACSVAAVSLMGGTGLCVAGVMFGENLEQFIAAKRASRW